MKFVGREEEIGELRRIRSLSRTNARFTVIMGRRRVGKTELVKNAMGDEPYLYFYVTKKAQPELCEEFRLIGTMDTTLCTYDCDTLVGTC